MAINTDIDFVFTWVDGNDPAWITRHNAMRGVTASVGDDCKGRYFDNDELRFSLRSIEKYAPWVRRIFIVTDGQVPEWLNTDNSKIQIVDHKEILPKEALPTFNSISIEHALYRIPGLSEKFLYSNDDMYINRPVEPEDFFSSDDLPRVRFTRQSSRELGMLLKERILRHRASNHLHALQNSSRLIARRYGRYFNCDPHHCVDAYLKSDYRATYNEFSHEIEPTLAHHFREDTDISRSLYSYAAIMRNRAHLEYVGRDVSFRLRIHKHKLYNTIKKYNPYFVCMNDSEHATDHDRKIAREFLESQFPQKSEFEK